MAYSNDWTITNNPADHSQFQSQPGYVRKLRQDIQDRLTSILYGFTSGETNLGVKYLPFYDQAGDAPTPSAGILNVYAKTVSSILGLYFINTAATVIQILTGLGGSFTGAINEAKGTDIPSATTTDIGAATGNYVNVTGTVTITDLGTIQAGTRRIVTFKGALVLTYNASSLILPGAANITTAAEDVGVFLSLGAGNWKCVGYTKADGTPLVFPAAVQADMESASSLVVAVTPGRTQYHPGVAKAWCQFNGSLAGTNAPIVGYNVTNITRNGTGDYTVNFTNPFSSGSYAYLITPRVGVGNNPMMGGGDYNNAPTASALRILTEIAPATLRDAEIVNVMVFGDQ